MGRPAGKVALVDEARARRRAFRRQQSPQRQARGDAQHQLE